MAFLTSHQNIYALTIKGNGTAIDKYTPNSAAKTINITPANIGAATSGHTHSQYLTSVSLATISDLHSSWDSVLKAQKPAWLTAVSLATISDLHANWDALLKAAPSAYVTRWPTAAEVGALTQSAADGRYVNVSGDTMTGLLSLSSGSTHKGARVGNVYVNAIDRALIIQNAKEIRFGQSDNWAYNDWGGLTYDHSKKYLYLGIADGTIFQQNAGALSGGSLLTPGIGNIFVGNNTSNKVWHAGNDGSGSGLDADLLDGTHKNGLFTAFTANGNSTRITIGGTTKDLTVPYASLSSILAKNSTFYSSGEGRLSYYDADIANTTNNNSWSAPSAAWHQILHLALSVSGLAAAKVKQLLRLVPTARPKQLHELGGGQEPQPHLRLPHLQAHHPLGLRDNGCLHQEPGGRKVYPARP